MMFEKSFMILLKPFVIHFNLTTEICPCCFFRKYHCHLVGYAIVKVPSSTQPPSNYRLYNQETIEMVQEALPQKRKGAQEVEEANPSGFTKPKTIHINCGERSQAVLAEKENYGENIYAPEALKLQSVTNGIAPARKTKPQIQIQHGRRDRKQAFNTMVQRRKQLIEQCMELEKSVEELTHKEQRLITELEVIRMLYNNLCADLSSAGKMDT